MTQKKKGGTCFHPHLYKPTIKNYEKIGKISITGYLIIFRNNFQI